MKSFYFYDLETSGFSPSEARIVQFGGQKTDLELNPIGEPDNILIKLSSDILPDPDAVLITGITPQQTIADGITEAEFLEHFAKNISTPGTVFTGFNSIRFDDEFMRYLQYRNFYDPYEWQWQDERSRWDMLDVVRMTRALRPEGIKWPVDSEGKPANRLGLLTSINGLEHANAHDALSDVIATIDLARLIRTKQPKLFDYLLGMRTKQKVSALALGGAPFVYTSGKYSSEHEKTTVVATIGKHPKKEAVLVYDLRADPEKILKMTIDQIIDAWTWKKDRPHDATFPVKVMQFNRCAAVAPLSVLDPSSLERLHLDLKQIMEHQKVLLADQDFIQRLHKAIDQMDQLQQAALFADERSVDSQLYESFVPDGDRRLMPAFRSSKPAEIMDYEAKFQDQRLRNLLPLYKARNYPRSLSETERSTWEKHCQDRLFAGGEKSRLAKYLKRIEDLKSQPSTTQKQQYLLTDLELYGQSLFPDF